MQRTDLYLIVGAWVSLLVFGFFVWPTPYTYEYGCQDREVVQINRFTGKTTWFQVRTGQGVVINPRDYRETFTTPFSSKGQTSSNRPTSRSSQPNRSTATEQNPEEIAERALRLHGNRVRAIIDKTFPDSVNFTPEEVLIDYMEQRYRPGSYPNATQIVIDLEQQVGIR